MTRRQRKRVPSAVARVTREVGFGWAWLAGWGAVLCLLGCEAADAPVPGASAPEERYYSRYTGTGRHWIPAAEINLAPQRSPMMLIWETTRFAESERPTPAERQAADRLYEASFEAARRKDWFDFQTGLDSGYELMFGDEVHYVNKDNIVDDVLLDPERPEFLMYYDTPMGKKLVGYMFYVTEPEAIGPQIGGRLTIWHFHTWKQRICLLQGLLAVSRPDSEDRCSIGAPAWRSPEMLHVWFVDHPGGRFATNMKLAPALVRRLVQARGY